LAVSITFHQLPAVADVALQADGLARKRHRLLKIRYDRQPQLLRKLRAYLGGVAVDGLPAAQHDVGVQLADGAGEDVAGGQRVAGGRPAVGDEHHAVGPAVQRLAENLASRWQPHGYDRHAAAVGVADGQGLLKGVHVLGVEDGRQGGAVDGAVFLHGCAGDPLGIGHLLGADDAVVSHSAPVRMGRI
jgi:hypothetical protein